MTDVVASVVGAAVPPDQPLMEAGLDSLGACLVQCTQADSTLDPHATRRCPPCGSRLVCTRRCMALAACSCGVAHRRAPANG